MGTVIQEWARAVDFTGLREIFKDEPSAKTYQRGVLPKAAIHHVTIKTTDTFSIPEMGEFEVPFEGYSRVVCSEPSTDDWNTAIIYVNYVEHIMFGHHPKLGGIKVQLNPDILSGGNIFPTPRRDLSSSSELVMACRVNIAAQFHVEGMNRNLFNKTPIQIASDDLRGVPPLGEGGDAHVFNLPLYSVDDPSGELVGYIDTMDYHVLDYASRELVTHFREASTYSQFKEWTG